MRMTEEQMAAAKAKLKADYRQNLSEPGESIQATLLHHFGERVGRNDQHAFASWLLAVGEFMVDKPDDLSLDFFAVLEANQEYFLDVPSRMMTALQNAVGLLCNAQETKREWDRSIEKLRNKDTVYTARNDKRGRR